MAKICSVVIIQTDKTEFLHWYFWGNSTNAIKMPVLHANSTITNAGDKKAATKLFTNMITVIRLHLMSYAALLEVYKRHL